jgi:hypothetical protein
VIGFFVGVVFFVVVLVVKDFFVRFVEVSLGIGYGKRNKFDVIVGFLMGVSREDIGKLIVNV